MKVKAAQEMIGIIEMMIASQNVAKDKIKGAKMDNSISDSFRTKKINSAASELRQAFEKGVGLLQGIYDHFIGETIARDGFVTGENAAQYQNAITIMKTLGAGISTDDLTILLEPFKGSPLMHRSLFVLAHEYCKDSASSHTSQAEIDKMPDNSAVKTTLGVVVSDCESLLMHISEIIENDGIWPIVLEMKRESLEGFI